MPSSVVQSTLLGPARIQRTRRKGSRLPAGAVCVSRPSRLGNMFAIERLPRHLFGEFGADPHRVYDITGRVPFRIEENIYPDRFIASVCAVRNYELHTGPFGSHEYDADTRAFIASIAGRDIACWCPLVVPGTNHPWPCHGNSILRWANNLPEDDFDEGADL